jgi:hypothetical protein
MLCRTKQLVFGLTLFTTIVGCAAEQEQDDAPVATLDTAGEADEGTAWDGWTQSAAGNVSFGLGLTDFSHTLTRSSGDAIRGGGGCLVLKTASSCSADATCTTSAIATYGAGAWGYCYSGLCYNRPGTQSALCALNPSRAPGTVSKVIFGGYPTTARVLGCMTKGAGPNNTSCGSTNTSLYMRSVHELSFSFDAP